MVGRRVAILVAFLALLSGQQAVASDEDAAAVQGTSYFTVTPCRLVDTRGPLGGPALTAGEKRIYTAVGSCAIPPGAVAMAVNLVVVQPATGGLARMYAGNTPTPPAVVLTFSAGQIRANNAIVQLATDASGTIALENFSGGNADFVIDVFGYFACGAIAVSPAGPALPAGTSGTPYNQTFTASGGSGSYSFAITSGSPPAGLTLSTGGVLSGTPGAAGDFSFTVTATDTVTGCAGVRSYTLHINCGTLTVAITPIPAQVCAGSTNNSASATAGFATYSWTITNGTIQGSTTSQAIVYTAGPSGNVGLTVNVTDASSCPGQATANVPINANPATPTITPAPAQVCANSTGNGATGPAGATTYLWTITNGTITAGASSQTVIYTAGPSGNVTLNLTVANAAGCTASNSAQVPINAAPATPTITPNPAQVCGGTSGNTASGPAGATTYLWTISNGVLTSANNIQTITYQAGASGNVTLNLTVTNASGCPASNSIQVPINASPATPAITPTPAQVCSASTGNTASGPAGATSYAWTATNGTITSATNIQTITYTAGASGNVTLNLTVTNAAGCAASNSVLVPINALPATPPIATSNPQTFTVSGGAGTFTLTFNGQTTSSLAFNATAAQVQTALTALSSIGGVGGTAAVSQVGNVYTVTFGGSLTGPQPQMTATGAGGATVVVSSPSVCADSTGNQARGPAGATSYAWTIGNGTITSATNIQTITYTAGSSGNVTLNLTVTNAAGCSASNSVILPINPSPSTPTITPTPAQLCGGTTGNTASGPAGATTYAWTISNGTITSATNIQTITYTAGASGSVTLNLTVTNASGCPASNSVLVPINASPGTPSITPTPAQVCANSTGNTADGPAGAASYAWTIGNGTITSATNIQTITYTAGASGSVTLNLTVTNAAGCAASNSALVPINANPAPPTILNSGPQMVTVTGGAGTFTLTFNGQTTSSLAFNATAAQVRSALDALSSIGGVGGSLTVNLAGGIYSVLFGGTLTGPQPLMTASGAGGATVVVSPTACADSTGNQASGPAGATTYAWTITNGAITSATNVQTITYTAGSSGTVTLSLTVTNAATCSASNSLLVTINPTPATPTITPTPASVCALSTGNTADGPAGATTYAWTITNGTITSATNIQTITYTAGASGNVTLGLTATNASNCSASNSLDVTINPAPATPTITPTPAQVCAGSTGNTASGPAGATTYAWSITNGTITSATNIQTITYTAGVAAGNVGLTLVVTNAQGCSASNTVNVTKNPNPTLAPGAGALPMGTYNTAYSQTFTPGGGTGPYTVVFQSGTLPNGITFSSNAISGTPIEPGGIATGNFSFTLRVTDTATSCFSDVAYTLYVQPKAVADACTGVGNTQLAGGALASPPSTPFSTNCNGVLTNDEGPGALTAALSGAATNGTVTVNSNGTYLFTPNLNATTGGFNYTLTDGNGATATGTVTLTFTGRVWYVNSTTGSDSAARGRSHEPLLTIAQAVTNASANDYIFVHFTGTNYAGASLSKDGLTLWGQGTTFTLGNLTITGTSKPTINSTLTIGGNNQTVSSLDINTGGSTGITNTGTRTGLTIKNNIAVTTTTGTAVSLSNVDSTAGGAPNNGINFFSVSSNGAGSGISLTNVNVSNGTFTVSGDGASDPANTTRGRTTAKLGGGSITLGSGGTINNTTGPAINLSNAKNATLRNLSLTGNAGGVNSGADGIHAVTVTSLTLDNLLVTGHLGNDGLSGSAVSDLNLLHTDIHTNAKTAGVDAVDVWNVRLDNLTGTSAVTNSLFFDALEDVFAITNTGSSNLTLTVTNSEFRDTSLAGSGNVTFAMLASGSSVTNLTITGSTFKNAKTTGVQYAGNNTSSGTIKVMNSVFGGTAAGGDAANQNGVDVDIAHQGAGTTLNFEVSGNTMRQGFRANDSTSINIFLAGLSTATSQMIGTVKNNVVGIAGTANSGSDLGAGIAIDCTGAGTMTASVTGNTVNQVRANSGNVFDAGMSQTAKLNLFLHGNTFNGNPAQSNPQYGIHINNGTGTPGETGQLCLDMGGNSVTMPASAIASVDLDAFTGTSTNLVGYTGAANNSIQIQNFLGSNPATTPPGANTFTSPATLYTAAGGSTQAGACGVVFPP